MLLCAALAYTLVMAALLPSIVPRVFEPLSGRPEALRATWAAAAILPLVPLQPLAGVPALLASSILAARGERLASTLVIIGYASFAVYTALRMLQNVL